jgi:hypothetical protein
MAHRPVAASGFPNPRTGLFGPALLAAVAATALLSAGEARALLVDGTVSCEALGAERACVPMEKELFDDFPVPYTVSDTGPGGDAMFAITATETTIRLIFTEFVSANTLNTTGFKLSGLQSIPALVPGELDVTFLPVGDDWGTLPSTRPFVTNAGGIQTIQWTLLSGADPAGGAIARINLQFVPEPGTAALLGLGLAGLGVVGRSKRQESEGTA